MTTTKLCKTLRSPMIKQRSVVGRPGKRRSRKTLTKQGKTARPRPIYVGAEFTGPVRLQHHTQQQRIQRAGVFRRETLVQLTNGHCCPAPKTATASYHYPSATCFTFDSFTVVDYGASSSNSFGSYFYVNCATSIEACVSATTSIVWFFVSCSLL